MTSIIFYLKRTCWLVLAVLLQSCGGGGDDSEPPQIPTILVNAGADISVNEGESVTLSAQTQSSDTSLTYTWSSTPQLAINHGDATAADASFTAPVVTELSQYSLTLTVTGSQGGRGQDSVLVTVRPLNLAPVAVITAPTFVDIEPDFIPAGETVVLDGSQSFDSDAPDPTRQIESWSWQQTAGIGVLTGQPTNLPQLSFTAPLVEQRVTLGFSLTVTDAEGASHTEEYAPVLLAQSETNPRVEAGLDQFVFSGEVIILAGEASTSVSSAMPLDIQWESSIDTLINRDDTANTFALAPSVDSVTQVDFSLTVVDGFGNRVEDTLQVQVSPVPVPVMNDTGVTTQSTQSANSSIQQNAFPRQDAQLGKDRLASSNTIEKAGRGRAGFDFTPLNDNGDEMDDLSSPWRCVRDNTTGLVWEVKTTDMNLSNEDYTYAWFQTQDNGGFAGTQTPTTAMCGITNCNTEAFVSAVNAQGLCGFFDWRLPNHDELMSIMDFGAGVGIKIDTDYFPNVGDNSNPELWYWTSQPGADGVSDTGAQNAWALDFVSGVDNFLNKSTAARVRLVRAGR